MGNKRFDMDGNCVKCGLKRTEDGHDPCIANLPGVLYACCGHGNKNGYLKFVDGRVLRFTPITIDLDPARHEVVERVAIYAEGENHRILKFKNGKIRTQTAKFMGILDNATTIEIRKGK